jgi:hypothetical protein
MTTLPLNNNSNFSTLYLGYANVFQDSSKTSYIGGFPVILDNVRGYFSNNTINITPIINTNTTYTEKWIESNLYQQTQQNVSGTFTFNANINSNTLNSLIQPNYKLYAFIKAFNQGWGFLGSNTTSIDPLGNFSISYTMPQDTYTIQWGFTVEGYPVSSLQESIDRGLVVINSYVEPPCFNKGTLILCIDGNKKIEDLNINDEIITYKHGPKKIKQIFHSKFKNDTSFSQLCKYKNLIITGGHSILVDELTNKEKELTINIWNELKMIDDKYLLLASIGDRFEKIFNENEYDIYHIVIGNEQYGIYADNVLSETMSYNFFKNMKYEKLLI